MLSVTVKSICTKIAEIRAFTRQRLMKLKIHFRLRQKVDKGTAGLLTGRRKKIKVFIRGRRSRRGGERENIARLKWTFAFYDINLSSSMQETRSVRRETASAFKLLLLFLQDTMRHVD